MSAIVAEPVPDCDVVSLILAPPQNLRGEPASPRATRCGSCRSYRCWPFRVGQVGQEESLIDSSLEDRHAQFHALLDHVAPFHSGFASELRGREMDCHQYESSW